MRFHIKEIEYFYVNLIQVLYINFFKMDIRELNLGN